MNWVRVKDRPPALGELVLVTIHGSDTIQLQPGETLEEAVERTRKGFRRVTIGMLDGEEEWTGADGWPMVVKPVAWAPLPEPWEEDYHTVSWSCSVCGCKFNFHEDDTDGAPYCPNCGAKMDEEEP